jgi:regulator of replication initiation timing
MSRRISRRIEDEIRSLCKQLLAGKDDEQQIEKLIELRAALRLHIERLRARVVDYPLVIERRQQEGIPSPEDTGG